MTSRSPAGREEASPRPIQVLHLLGTLQPSGMERMLVAAARAFEHEGVRGAVVGQGRGHLFESELTAAGYGVHIVPDTRTLRGMLALHRLIRRVRPDVVHVHTEGMFLFTVLNCFLALRAPRIVHTVHSTFSGTRAWRLRRILQIRLADRLLSEVVVPSSAVLANERGFGRRPTLIWNWVDRRFFELREERLRRPRRPGAHRFLLLGNCAPPKNHELAVEAVQRSGGVLSHLGDERRAEPAEQTVLDALAAEGRIGLRGPQTPDEAMLDADCFLMPSRAEGMGVALAEAITVGLPALITDVPGLSWAAATSGVTVLPLEGRAWDAAVRDFVPGPSPDAAIGSIDFTPERGAREYAASYRRALRMRR